MPSTQFSAARIEPLCIEAVEEVLSTMFFEGLSEPVRRESVPPDGGARSRVRFRGTLTGCIDLILTEPAAHALSKNFLGWPDDRTPGAEAENLVVGELANICCGSLLSRLEPEGHFEIGAPESGATGAADSWLEFPLMTGRLLLAAHFTG